MEMIAAAVTKVQSGDEFKTKMQKKSFKARVKVLVAQKRLAKEFDAEMDRLNENYNVWTDGPQYLEKHYGGMVEDAAKGDEWN
jgi:hypothetical protein|tara:strand:+ start:13771 stop:14019 length:249 start_codon:yes stop_codon:yes gene_type:complete